MKPRIALPTPNTNDEYSCHALPQYIAALEAAGATVVVVALDLAVEQIASLAQSCDGVLLPGSPADVDPQKYDAPRHPRTAAADAARDNVDELLLQDAYSLRKPLLSICYGTQALNVWRGGTLVQHLETAVQHARTPGAPRSEVIEHDVRLEPRSLLAALNQGELAIVVNSSHHQAVARPGDGLHVTARSPRDGVIEALESITDEHFVLAVQWHPERTYETSQLSRRIFARLVDEARRFHQRLTQAGPNGENI